METTRLAPPSGPPPPYQKVITKVYPYTLRPVMIFINFLGFIWALIVGIKNLMDVGKRGASTSINTYSIVIGALLLVVAAIEAFAIVVAALARLTLAKFLLWVAPAGAAIAIVSEILSLATHFTLKSDLIEQCVTIETERKIPGYEISETKARNWCSNSWSSDTWRHVVWLIVILVLAALFCAVALSYYRQLLDPNSVRTRQTRVNQSAYPLQPHPPYQMPHESADYHASIGPQGYVPPYPGPPPEGSPFAPKQLDVDGKDRESEEMTYQAQERAWQDAQRNAPTLGYMEPGSSHPDRSNGSRV